MSNKFDYTDIKSDLLVSANMGVVTTGAIAYLEIIVPNATYNREVSISNLKVIADQLIKAELIEAPTITNGTTAVGVICRDRTQTVTPATLVYSDPTAVSAGTTLFTYAFGTASQLVQEDNMEELHFNLKKNTKYVIKLTNLSGSSTTFLNVLFSLFEI